MHQNRRFRRLASWTGVLRASSKLLYEQIHIVNKDLYANVTSQLKQNRTGQATSVLGAVRARHNELQRIESTLTDLAALFADMAQIVEAQDPVVERTEQNAMQTVDDIDNANTQLDKSNEHARRRRRNKWYCFLVVVLIILAIALGVGLGIGLPKAAANNARRR